MIMKSTIRGEAGGGLKPPPVKRERRAVRAAFQASIPGVIPPVVTPTPPIVAPTPPVGTGVVVIAVAIQVPIQLGIVFPDLTAILRDFSSALSHFIAQARDLSRACVAPLRSAKCVQIQIVFLNVASQLGPVARNLAPILLDFLTRRLTPVVISIISTIGIRLCLRDRAEHQRGNQACSE